MVDNERTVALQKVCVCVCVYAALWSGAWSRYIVATRTFLLYTRQQFSSKVIVHSVLFSSPNHIRRVFNILLCPGVKRWEGGWNTEMGLSFLEGG